MMKKLNLRNVLGVALASVVLLVSGCGGGGGGGSSSSSSSTPTTPIVTIPTLTVKLTDTVTGSSTNTLTLGGSVKASATVLDGSQKPVANTVVTFKSSPSSLIAITPVAATALTDANGVASVLITPASASAAGAGTLSASALVNTASATGSVGFSVNAASIGLSGIAVGQSLLSPYGTTSVTVNVTGVPTSYPVTVDFVSLCAASSKATVTASVQSINGVATANYTDKNCAGLDTITASVSGTTVSSSIKLTVQAPGIASVQFVSATPESIVLKGTGAGGYQESSLVKFKVVDNNNQPVPNTSVELDLSTRTGGILLDFSTSKITKLTDASGEVQVSVQAGTNPTPVWVTAAVASAGNTFKTQSVKLSISTGRPAQDRFSLSVGTHNIEGWNHDGVTDNVLVIASDRVGNPVPNGTTVNFVASGAQIQPSCQTLNGQCTVTFTSAAPRTDGSPEPSDSAVSAGRVVVLAYALGEESFFDSNGDNFFTDGESFTNLGNVFVDRNENNIFDSNTEEYIPFDVANNLVCGTPLANSPSAPSMAGTCDNKWGAAHVRKDIVIVLSGDVAYANKTLPTPGFSPNHTYSMPIIPSADPAKNTNCEASFSFYLFDLNRNPMPAGTKLSFENLPDKVTAVVSNDTVVDTPNAGGTQHSFTVKKTASDGICPLPTSTFRLQLTAKTPMGLVSIIPLEITTTP